MDLIYHSTVFNYRSTVNFVLTSQTISQSDRDLPYAYSDLTEQSDRDLPYSDFTGQSDRDLPYSDFTGPSNRGLPLL